MEPRRIIRRGVEESTMICKNKYPISMEVTGRFAMFADPSSGSNATSYPAPPKCAAKGIIEQVLFIPFVKIVPTKVEICNPLRTVTASTNYNGHLRKSSLIKHGNPCQIREVCLFDVCYKIHGYVVNIDPAPGSQSITKKAMQYELKHINHAHSFVAQFERRLRRGRFYRQPHLGRSEFLCEYFGPLRDETTPDKTINLKIPAMLVSCFDRAVHGSKVEPTFAPAEIKEGVLIYA